MKPKGMIRIIMAAAIVAVMAMIASFSSAQETVLHRVLVRNSSSQTISPLGMQQHYVLTVKSPACAAILPGTMTVPLSFSSSGIPPGGSLEATYRTSGDDLITDIRTEWTVRNAKKNIVCEVSPNTCGDLRTKDYLCEITDVHVIRVKNGLGTTIVAR